jgi:hypothetical protein
MRQALSKGFLGVTCERSGAVKWYPIIAALDFNGMSFQGAPAAPAMSLPDCCPNTVAGSYDAERARSVLVIGEISIVSTYYSILPNVQSRGKKSSG